MKKLCKEHWPWILIIALLLIFIIYVIWGNISLEITEYTVISDRLPESFSGFRIAQISDLHNTEFGRDNSRLLEKLKDIQPDIIVLTGDLVDSRRTDLEIAISFARKAVSIAPTYYVPGNHEERIPKLNDLIAELGNAGVTVLLDDSIMLKQGNDQIRLAGILDLSFRKNAPETETKEAIDAAIPDTEQFSILLSHNPELFHIYNASNADLVLSGHVHGGQFRLPFVGGLYAPGQGFFPEYDAGTFAENGTTMIVSRGLGNSLFPFRIGNSPEIVVIEIQNGKSKDI